MANRSYWSWFRWWHRFTGMLLCHLSCAIQIGLCAPWKVLHFPLVIACMRLVGPEVMSARDCFDGSDWRTHRCGPNASLLVGAQTSSLIHPYARNEQPTNKHRPASPSFSYAQVQKAPGEFWTLGSLPPVPPLTAQWSRWPTRNKPVRVSRRGITDMSWLSGQQVNGLDSTWTSLTCISIDMCSTVSPMQFWSTLPRTWHRREPGGLVRRERLMPRKVLHPPLL